MYKAILRRSKTAKSALSYSNAYLILPSALTRQSIQLVLLVSHLSSMTDTVLELVPMIFAAKFCVDYICTLFLLVACC